MLRLILFFAVAWVLAGVLGHVPVIGVFFRHTGIFGIWITALLLSWGINKWGRRAVQVRRNHSQIRELSAVESPHNLGKIGSLYLAQGRAKKALEPLEAAAAGEPDSAEWHYRLGCAYLELGRGEEAAAALGRATELDQEHAYGAAQMRLAQALSDCERHAESLEALAVFERNHGPSPESAYRRGLAHKGAGEKSQALEAFAEVSQLSTQAAKYQQRQAGLWSLKARMASLF